MNQVGYDNAHLYQKMQKKATRFHISHKRLFLNKDNIRSIKDTDPMSAQDGDSLIKQIHPKSNKASHTCIHP